jgi:hypothetical protein
MQSAASPPTIPAPTGWSPQVVIAAAFPATSELRRAILPEIRKIESRLDAEESAGRDTSRMRQTLRELRWRLEYTGNVAAVGATFERLRATAAQPSPPEAAGPEENGSYGLGTEIWFLKLDASADHMLADDFDDRGRPPRFLDRINDPVRLRQYLDGLLVSRLADDGIDRRKELNFATAALVRLILRRRPRSYPWDPRLDTVVRRFVAEWQDPVSGFFGAVYHGGGCRLRTVDLSLTFHMARYLEGRIGHWPQLIETLFSIRDQRYPHGWLDEGGMTCHNNYDVAMLLQLGWQHMRADQRWRGRQELDRLLGWCLSTAVMPDGSIAVRAAGETLSESYYFVVAFLDTIGYFDPAKRFWTDRTFPDAHMVRARLASRLRRLPKSDPMARMGLERLRRGSTECGPALEETEGCG